MKVISIVNYKGGVGKTTVTANLGAELAERGKNVLLIDLDPQASLTFSFIKPEEWNGILSKSRTVRNWLDPSSKKIKPPFKNLIYSPSDLSKHLRFEGKFDLISSHLELINTEIEMASELGGTTLRQTKNNYLNMHTQLAKGIRKLAPDRYDYVLIDCAPNFNIITKNAIVACDFVMIPAKADYLSTLGILYLQKSFDSFVTEYNEFIDFNDDSTLGQISPKIMGIIFTMIQFYGDNPIKISKGYIRDIKGLTVFDNYIRENNTLFGDAPDLKKPVVLKKPTNEAEKKAIEGIKHFVDEFENAIKSK
jgi:chromosome partitioning protein